MKECTNSRGYRGQDCSEECILHSDGSYQVQNPHQTFTREQVVVLVLKGQHDYSKFVSDSHFSPNCREKAEFWSNWLNENL